MVKWQGSARRLHHRIAWRLMTGVAIIAFTAGCTRLGKKDPPRQKLAAINYSKQARPPLKSNHPLYVATAHWAKQNQKNPADARAAINYAKNLKALGSKEKALNVLALSYQLNRGHGELASEYGRLALDLGRTQVAEPLLNQAAQSRGQADWRVLSALGTVNAKRGDHKKAQSYYMAALRKKPDSESVFNNLALSYALDGKAGDAEVILKKAVSRGHDSERIRQNLALVLGLQNKNSEAQMVAQADVASARVEKNKKFSRSIIRTAKNDPATEKTGKTKARADTMTTASLPARNPKPSAKSAKVATAHNPKAPPKPAKVTTARKAAVKKPAVQTVTMAPAPILPWHKKPSKPVKVSRTRTASLAAQTPAKTISSTPDSDIDWNVSVKKNIVVKAMPAATPQTQSHILKRDRDFSFPAGN